MLFPAGSTWIWWASKNSAKVKPAAKPNNRISRPPGSESTYTTESANKRLKCGKSGSHILGSLARIALRRKKTCETQANKALFSASIATKTQLTLTTTNTESSNDSANTQETKARNNDRTQERFTLVQSCGTSHHPTLRETYSSSQLSKAPSSNDNKARHKHSYQHQYRQ
ncbi:hypothetical protein KC19_VG096300 [Ceratodon purpureus]|uniref:Uncharacterized protein n=1 Tax=Ceratodon purpureus TaxID=3225 RepID=A0A8T0HNS8_CERPU|nr:hypothetical protein KC19_VG096300 [Ceratodon purpureus]